MTSSQNSEQIINNSIPLKSCHNKLQLNLNETVDIINGSRIFSNIRILTEFSLQIIIYIAGFVVRYLKKSLYCEECINALTSDNEEDINILIQIKSYGNLQYPLRSVIKICCEAERVVRFALYESGGKLMKNRFKESYLVNCILQKFIGSNNLFSNLTQQFLITKIL